MALDNLEDAQRDLRDITEDIRELLRAIDRLRQDAQNVSSTLDETENKLERLVSRLD